MEKKKPTDSETTFATPSPQAVETPPNPAPKEPEFKTLLERVVAITERGSAN